MLKYHAVELVEVGPRDGLQNEAAVVSTADKLELIRRAIDYGVRRIEVTSFVNPKKVPQLADAEELVAMLPDRDDVTYIGLVLNRRGAERALATGRIDELGAVCVTSDSFGIRNQGQSSDESLAAAMEIVALAKAAGRSGQITIATAFGCPFEGKVAIDRVVEMAKRAADASPREIALADTIGVGVPAQVSEMVGRVREAVGDLPVRVHFHNTRGTGVANVWAAVNEGAATVDASLGGLGGCPFAPGAAGNVATEDVIYMLEQSGIGTGVTLPRVVEAAGWLTGVMGRPLPAMVSKAPAFP
ncbi:MULTISPECIES: hydroxymethylglutaryl-CoA lyase [unclassified Sphingopyxis]|jgi:hydroxymethylglutaryl-CoA lyase|uniref:hydroxymethylglutaryl-CoA lyase n=1 Tax=unclassified Sphingopyxis TaxID=2614943 RepID=UPI00285E2278|nr:MULTISPECIES: hydroxymethylglutaryl-CoA lyase [unclassified Sphingopyxis]MDR7059423.1 hydroxymethylglutaryl-CoA lyase [Sphingopyxis sp. BE235]MDR7181065.1 hydroxymethylglutaryl-CoA lyase [Sphingopyxis sp. BE249]